MAQLDAKWLSDVIDTDFFAISGSSLSVKTPLKTQHMRFTLLDPAGAQALDTQVCICPKLPAAITITRVDVTHDSDPTTELDADLKFADTFIGLGSATLIVALDTANGVAAITSGWNDNTVPIDKCLYLEFGAAPDSNATQLCIDISFTYD